MLLSFKTALLPVFESVVVKYTVCLSDEYVMSYPTLFPVDRFSVGLEETSTASSNLIAYVTLSPGTAYAGMAVFPFTAYRYGSAATAGAVLSVRNTLKSPINGLPPSVPQFENHIFAYAVFFGIRILLYHSVMSACRVWWSLYVFLCESSSRLS